MRRAAFVLACWASAAPAAAAQAAPDWRLMAEDEQLPARVWLRDRPGGFPAFRASTVIEARLSSLAAVLLDSTRTPDWVYRAREARVLRSDGPTRGVSLVVTAMPFPLSDRESVIAWEMTQDAATGVVTLQGRDTTEAPPPDPRRVRMVPVESRWVLAPRADGRVDVTLEGLGDPGGSLSSPLLRGVVGQAVWQGPWETVRALHRIVREPGFAQVVLPFIREP